MYLPAFAREARKGARNAFRNVQLSRGLAALERVLRGHGQPDLAHMQRLVRAWGNEAWSGDAMFLMNMLKWMQQTSGPIVECGSGLSTLLLASAATPSGRRVYSLEQNPRWAEFTNGRMPESLKGHVSVLAAPLRSYGSFDWYSIGVEAIPDSVGYVVCDGPPADTRGGRYGLGPVLGSRLARGSIILLDDTHRPEERAIVGRWCSELGASVVQEGATFTAIRVGQDGENRTPS